MDFEKVLSDSAVSAVRVFMSLIRGIVLIPLITKFIGADAYGTWTTILAITTFFVSVGGLHLKGSLIRYGPREERAGQTFFDTLSITAISATGFSCLIVLLHFLGVPVLPRLPSQNALHLLAALVSMVFLGIMSRTVYNYPRSQGKVKLFEFARTGQLVCESVGLVIVLWSTQSLVFALWMMAAIRLAVMGLLLAVHPPPQLRWPDPARFRQYLAYSLPIVPATITGTLFDEADKYLLFFLLSPAAAGIYGVSYSIARLFQLMQNVFGPTLYPTVTQAWDDGEMAELRNLYSTIFKWYAAVCVPALVGLTYLVEPVLLLISTPEIAQQGKLLFPLLGLGFCVQGFDQLMSYLLNAAEETEKIALISTTSAAVNIALNVVLIPTVGIFGAVVATVIAQLMRFVYVWRQTRAHIRYEIPVLPILKAASASALMLLALVFFPVPLSWQGQLAVYPVVGFVVYVVGFVVTRGVTPKELRDLYALIHS